MIWVTSDWHLNHRNIAEYCGRPANHQDLILERTAALVGPQDALYHLGGKAAYRAAVARIRELSTPRRK